VPIKYGGFLESIPALYKGVDSRLWFDLDGFEMLLDYVLAVVLAPIFQLFSFRLMNWQGYESVFGNFLSSQIALFLPFKHL